MNNIHNSTHVSTYFNDALVDRIDTQKYLKSNGKIKKVVSDADNQYTAAIDDSGNITVIVHKLNRFVSIKPSSPATQAVFIRNGNLLVAQQNGHISQYLASNGKLTSVIKHHNSKLLALEYNPVTKQILTIASDQCTLWDALSFTKIKTLFAKASYFASGSLTPNGQSLITSFQDGNVYVWNLNNFEVTAKSEVEENMKNQKMCVSSDSSRFVIGGSSAYLYYCDVSHSPLCISSFALPSGSTSVKKIKFTHGNYLGIITDNQVFYAIDSSTNQIALEFRLPKNKGITDFDINPNNLEILIVSGSGEIFKYDLQKLFIMEMNQQQRLLERGIESSLVYNVLKPGNQNHSLKFESHLDYISHGKENVIINGESKLVNDPDDLMKANTQRETNIIQLCTFPKHTLEKMFKSALINVDSLPNMSVHKLRQFLQKHKIYPDKHRALIYKQLLDLPLNVDNFATLVQKGLYPSFKDLYRKYPISDSKLYQKMQTILSCLAHFCDLFGESDQFIQIAFPFVKLFGQEELLAFEIVLCFAHQILQNYFVDFPHPPLDLLQNIDEIIKYNDPILHQHLKQHNFKFVDYIWPFLSGFFTSALDKESWLQLIDYLITYNDTPELFMFITAAFIIYFKHPLMKLKSKDELEIFISRQNPVSVIHIIESGFSLLKRTPIDKIFVKFSKVLPLSKTSYNQFTKYNVFNVAHSRLTRQQETEAEAKLEESKHKIRQMQSLTDQILSVEQRYKEKQENLIRSEQIRREEVIYNAEQKLSRQMKLEESIKQTRLQQLNKIHTLTRANLQAQEELRQKELDLLEAELQYQQQMDGQQLQNRREEIQILEMEAQAAARLRQVMELREKEDRQRMVRMDMDIHRQQEEDRDNALIQQWRVEDTEMRLRRETLKQKKLQDLYKYEEENEKKLIEAKMLETEILKEQQMRDIERERKLRQIAEQELDQNERYAEYVKQVEQEQLKTQIHKLQETLNHHRQKALNFSQTRLNQAEEEKNRLLNEIQIHKNMLSVKQKQLQTGEIESQIAQKRRDAEQNIIEHEKKLQTILLDIENEKRLMYELQSQILQREKDVKEQEGFYDVLKENEQRTINENRYQTALQQQRFEEDLNRQTMQKSYQQQQRLQEQIQLREQQLLQETDQMRETIQQENMRRLEEAVNNNTLFRNTNNNNQSQDSSPANNFQRNHYKMPSEINEEEGEQDEEQ
ncbi:hypothetical protein ABPG74_020831 [Tetrahymena malaccensis]